MTSTGTLTLDNLTLTGGKAQGGAGGAGGVGGGAGGGAGGGGAGLGGAVLDNGGFFTAEGVTFMNNTAQGGQGGTGGTGPGGGGGLGVAASGSMGGGSGGMGGNGGGADGEAGGVGGFGGGGGGGAGSAVGNLGGAGGAGGFGGGGGAGGSAAFVVGAPGAGGFGGGAGQGSSHADGNGGGGAGLGGGIFSNGGILVLYNDTFTDNTAGGGGATTSMAAHSAQAGSGFGGAVFVLNGSLTATNDTFSLNTAAQGGTDVYVLSDLTDTGVIGGGTATVALNNDILGQSGGVAIPDFVANSTAVGLPPSQSGTNNLLSNNTAMGDFTGGVVAATDPMLGGLAANGGPTDTLAPQAGSSVIDAGSDAAATTAGLTTDQRGTGFARIVGTVDIGAVEVQPTLTSVSPTSVVAGSGATTITLIGTNLVSTSVAEFNGTALPTTFVSSTQETAVIPAADLAAAGTASITVAVPTSQSGVSNALTFTIIPITGPAPPPTSTTAPPPSVSLAFGPAGQVLELVNSEGVLTQFDATGAHVLGGGVRSAGVAFGPNGMVLEVVGLNNILTQFDAAGRTNWEERAFNRPALPSARAAKCWKSSTPRAPSSNSTPAARTCWEPAEFSR